MHGAHHVTYLGLHAPDACTVNLGVRAVKYVVSKVLMVGMNLIAQSLIVKSY